MSCVTCIKANDCRQYELEGETNACMNYMSSEERQCSDSDSNAVLDAERNGDKIYIQKVDIICDDYNRAEEMMKYLITCGFSFKACGMRIIAERIRPFCV